MSEPLLSLFNAHDCCSDQTISASFPCFSGKVNAIAGANKRRLNQQATADAEEAESSTSTSDESSEDDEMQTEQASVEVIEPPVSADHLPDTVCDQTDVASMDTSAVDDVAEQPAVENTDPATVRQTAVHIVVNRTAEIQVSCRSYYLFR